MSETLTPQEIEAQIELRLQRFKQVISDIRTVLRADLAGYIPREAKRAFLEQPGVSTDLSDERLAELKQRAAEVGARSAERIDEALADESLWTSAEQAPSNARELTESSAVWEHVASIELDLRSLLSDYGFAPPAHRYKAPTFFVSGLYLPSLTEHYWRLIQEVAQLREQKQHIVDTSVREALESRWNDA